MALTVTVGICVLARLISLAALLGQILDIVLIAGGWIFAVLLTAIARLRHVADAFDIELVQRSGGYDGYGSAATPVRLAAQAASRTLMCAPSRGS